MTINESLEPKQRIQILDILRGFALLGIIFNNMEYFSGYEFMPFDDLKQVTNFELDEKLYSFLDIIITAKFFTLFSILFAVGFYIQYNKQKEDSVNFLKTYRRMLLLIISQIFLCLFYITSILEIVKTSAGKKVLNYLIPLGRTALSNYLLQTIFMIIVFYNFGFGLFGKIGLFQTTGIVTLLLAAQIIFSNVWLKHFRFGPFEWIWRSFTYKKWIKIRY